jgi:hypothetical protein
VEDVQEDFDGGQLHRLGLLGADGVRRGGAGGERRFPHAAAQPATPVMSSEADGVQRDRAGGERRFPHAAAQPATADVSSEAAARSAKNRSAINHFSRFQSREVRGSAGKCIGNPRCGLFSDSEATCELLGIRS